MSKSITREFPATDGLCLPRHLCKPRLRRVEASEYLAEVYGIQIAPTTLAKLASIGGGPGFNKCGHTPLYPTAELDAWAIARLGAVVRSTSEFPAKREIADQAGEK